LGARAVAKGLEKKRRKVMAAPADVRPDLGWRRRGANTAVLPPPHLAGGNSHFVGKALGFGPGRGNGMARAGFCPYPPISCKKLIAPVAMVALEKKGADRKSLGTLRFAPARTGIAYVHPRIKRAETSVLFELIAGRVTSGRGIHADHRQIKPFGEKWGKDLPRPGLC